MKTGKRSSTDLITGSGILITLACLCAKESAYIQPFESLKLVNTTVEGMRKLHGPMPEELES